MKKLFAFMLLLFGAVQGIYAQEPYAVLSDNNTTLTFYYDSNKKVNGGMRIRPFTYYYGDVNSGWFEQRNNITKVVFDKSFSDCTSITSTTCWFYNCSKLSTINGLENLNMSNVTNMSRMFEGCSSLTNIDLSKFNTANVTDMSYMFSGCSCLPSLDVSKFNTDNVTDMSYMFDGCSALTNLDVSKFNTANVTKMSSMFSGCSGLVNLDVGKFNTDNVTYMSDMFRNCSGLTSLDVSKFNTDHVTTMYSMFFGCSGLTSLDVSKFNTDHVTNMNSMFCGCSSLTSLDVSKFNTANVIDMSYMFDGCSALTNLDMSKFNTANVTYTSCMFSGCSWLTSLDLRNFDTDNVKEMKWMFSGCSALTIIYSEEAWSCESSDNMFYGCTSLKGAIEFDSNKTNVMYASPTDGYFTSTGKVILRPYAVLSENNTKLTFYYDSNKKAKGGMSIGPFNNSWAEVNSGWFKQRKNITTVVFDDTFADYADLTSTAWWFYECSNLASFDGLEKINTANVTDMSGMFERCSSLTSLDLTNFNTANVINMSNMFFRCSSLTSLDISKFNTANVTIMNYMFESCSSLTSLDLRNFDTDNVTSMTGMFSYCSALTTIYCNDVWKCSSSSDDMFYGCTSLIGDAKYFSLFTDVTYASPIGGYFTPKGKMIVRPYAILSADKTTLTFYFDGNKDANGGMGIGRFTYYNSSVNSFWYEQRENITTVVFDDTFADCTSISSTAYWFYDCSNLSTIKGLEKLNTSNVTDMSYMFYRCAKLTSLDVSKFNTAKVTKMNRMFSGCSGLTSLDVRKFNTANVTDMSSMFSGCSKLTSLDVSKFNTANVINMNAMFLSCSSLTSLDVRKFNTANVTNMNAIFQECSNLTEIDVSNFVMDNVTNLSWMFNGCRNLTHLDVGNFNTAKVTDMSNMFGNCYRLTNLDLSNFNSTNVTNMGYMFYGCSNLTSLDISSFNTAKVKNMNYMFYGCSGLSSIEVSNFDTSNVTDMAQIFCGCSSMTSLDVSNFNTANVKDLTNMFYRCSKLTSLDLRNFDTDNVTKMNQMFYACSALTTIYCEEAWSCESSNNMFYGCKSLKGAISFDIGNTDIAGASPTDGYFTATGKEILRPYAVLSDDNTKLTFYYDAKKKSNLGMGIGPFTNNINWNTYQREVNSGWYNQRNNITTVVFDKSFANYTDFSCTAYWFYGCSNLSAFDGLEKLDTSNVTDMSHMFDGCSSLTNLDMSKLNTANVTDMNSMFSGCSSLTTIFSNDEWNCDMSDRMFYECRALKGVISYNGNKTDCNYANPTSGYFKSFTRGDADGNGVISDNDVEIVKNYIMDEKPEGFVNPAADANNDGVVNIVDIVEIINKK